MRIAILTFAVPPFDYKSPWWWCMDTFSNREETLELIGPSGEHQFQRQELSAGTAHLLNIFADQDENWTEQERVEFSVKCYVYLSKLHKRDRFDRFVIADCGGTEPLISSNLSVLAPTWVKLPLDSRSSRGQQGAELLKTAEKRFGLQDFCDGIHEENWPPDESDWEAVLDGITDK